MAESRVLRSGGVVIPMNVNYILGEENISHVPLQPYSQMVIQFLGDVSTALLKDSNAKQYSDIITFAFWCRKTNLLRMKEEANIEENRLGRGLVFHITPSNIPINFVFSYAFGLLSGNANLVRVPSKPFIQISIVRDIVKKVLESYPQIKERTAWVSYPASLDITEYFSNMADGRLIWGGDETVNLIKKCGTNPKCIDLAFADRYSFALMDGKKILESSKEEINQVAEAFYHDTWQMDQNACSSPKLIFWLNQSKDAKEYFWNQAADYAEKKYHLQPSSCVDKYLQLCKDAIEEEKINHLYWRKNIAYCIELSKLEDITKYSGKCGYFYEYDIKQLEDLTEFITKKVQTITYFGIDPKKIQRWVIDNNLKGIDRIVPFGAALDMDIIWDGYDIVRMLSRVIKLK